MVQMNRWIAAVLVIGVALGCSGCNIAGFAASAIAGDDDTISVAAETHILDNQTIAVLVDADPGMLLRFPTAQLEVCTVVSRTLAANVPGAKLVDPRDVLKYQDRDIYWTMAPYSKIGEKLGVTRIVVITLSEYRTHEAGNVNLFRGVITAGLGVAAVDGENKDDLTYYWDVSVAYPPDTQQALPNQDEIAIRKGMLESFAIEVAGKFADHQEKRQ